MVPQGKAYRTTLDETYSSEWVTLYEDWLTNFPRPTGDVDYEADPSTQPAEIRDQFYAWRPIDVAYRVEDQCDLLYYFMQSVNFTPQWLSAFLNNLAEQTEHIKSHYSEDRNSRPSRPRRIPRRYDLPGDEECRGMGRKWLGVDEQRYRRECFRRAESRLQRPDESKARL